MSTPAVDYRLGHRQQTAAWAPRGRLATNRSQLRQRLGEVAEQWLERAWGGALLTASARSLEPDLLVDGTRIEIKTHKIATDLYLHADQLTRCRQRDAWYAILTHRGTHLRPGGSDARAILDNLTASTVDVIIVPSWQIHGCPTVQRAARPGHPAEGYLRVPARRIAGWRRQRPPIGILRDPQGRPLAPVRAAQRYAARLPEVITTHWTTDEQLAAESLLGELGDAMLEVVLVPAPDQRHRGQMIRQRVDPGYPQWYRRILAHFADHGPTRRGHRGSVRHQVEQALQRIATNEPLRRWDTRTARLVIDTVHTRARDERVPF